MGSERARRHVHLTGRARCSSHVDSVTTAREIVGLPAKAILLEKRVWKRTHCTLCTRRTYLRLLSRDRHHPPRLLRSTVNLLRQPRTTASHRDPSITVLRQLSSSQSRQVALASPLLAQCSARAQCSSSERSVRSWIDCREEERESCSDLISSEHSPFQL